MAKYENNKDKGRSEQNRRHKRKKINKVICWVFEMINRIDKVRVILIQKQEILREKEIEKEANTFCHYWE